MYDNVGVVKNLVQPILGTLKTHHSVRVARRGSRAPGGRSSQTLDAGLATPTLQLGNEA